MYLGEEHCREGMADAKTLRWQSAWVMLRTTVGSGEVSGYLGEGLCRVPGGLYSE